MLKKCPSKIKTVGHINLRCRCIKDEGHLGHHKCIDGHTWTNEEELKYKVKRRKNAKI